MKKKIVWVFMYPFEYALLQEYLNEKAKQGWRLVKMKGNTSCILTFERSEEQEFYVVDYTKEYSMLVPNQECAGAKRYREFVEEYGYDYVTSNGPLQIYRSHTMKGSLRENNEEDKAILRKSVHKSAIWLFISNLLFLFYVWQSFTSLRRTLFTNGDSLWIFVGMSLFALFWTGIVLHYLYWIITSHVAKHFRTIQIRSVVLISLWLVVMAILCIVLTHSWVFSLGMLLVIALAMFALSQLWNKSSKNWVKAIGTVVILYVLLQGFVRIAMPDPFADTTTYQQHHALADVIEAQYDTQDKEVSMMRQSSPFSQWMSYSAYSSQEEAPQQEDIKKSLNQLDSLNVNWYQIQPGIWEGYLKAYYISEDGMEWLCRGHGKPKEIQGVTMYEGTYDYLFLQGNTYVNISKQLKLDENGWKLIHTLLKL